MRKKLLKCALCNKFFYKSISKLKNSRSGLYFCCRKHKDIAQRTENGFKAIQPPHYKNGICSYRKKAFRCYKHECSICQYNRFLQILEVHHKDWNRNNNNINNLEILCPTCHKEKKIFKFQG